MAGGCPNCGGVVSANADSGCGCYITGRNGVKVDPTTGGFIVSGDIKADVRTDTLGPALQWDPASGCMILRPAVICAQCGAGGDGFAASARACNGLNLEDDGWWVEQRRYREEFAATNADPLPGSFPRPYESGANGVYRTTNLTVSNNDPCGRPAIATIEFEFYGLQVEMDDDIGLLDIRPQINWGTGIQQPTQMIITDTSAGHHYDQTEKVTLPAGGSVGVSAQWAVGTQANSPIIPNAASIFTVAIKATVETI